MMGLALVVTVALAAGVDFDGGVPAPEPEPAAQPEPNPDEWPGEHRRVHFGVGLRVHGGLMGSGGALLWLAQSELVGMVSIRVRKHDELRIQLGVGAGFPDTFGGETNVSFHHSFSRRVSLGIGGFVYWGFWSMRLGVEAPLIIRIGSSRRHQLLVSLRAHSGVFNNVPIYDWTLASQRFAIAGDLAVGYLFQF